MSGAPNLPHLTEPPAEDPLLGAGLAGRAVARGGKPRAGLAPLAGWQLAHTVGAGAHVHLAAGLASDRDAGALLPFVALIARLRVLCIWAGQAQKRLALGLSGIRAHCVWCLCQEGMTFLERVNAGRASRTGHQAWGWRIPRVHKKGRKARSLFCTAHPVFVATVPWWGGGCAAVREGGEQGQRRGGVPQHVEQLFSATGRWLRRGGG